MTSLGRLLTSKSQGFQSIALPGERSKGRVVRSDARLGKGEWVEDWRQGGSEWTLLFFERGEGKEGTVC
ncbi:hypothetical protein BDW68DRAFT_162007, partial [Aspergillus falconensis]